MEGTLDIALFQIDAEHVVILFDGTVHFGNIEAVPQHFLHGVWHQLPVRRTCP